MDVVSFDMLPNNFLRSRNAKSVEIVGEPYFVDNHAKSILR